MKRLLLIALIIFLGVFIYFQYQNYKRFNPPSEYTFAIHEGVDANYFDPAVLQQYYDNAYELASFGRDKWANEGIDVKYPEEDEDSRKAAAFYNKKLSITNRIQDLLIYSAELKSQGFNNNQIKEIIESGLSPKNYLLLSNTNYIGLKRGDESQEVWEIQKMFINLGYTIPRDGKFGIETETAIKDYQLKNDLYGSGIINEQTLKKLLKVK